MKSHWEIQQQCPEENWIGDPENRWIRVGVFMDKDNAIDAFRSAKNNPNNVWPTRLVEFSARVIIATTILSQE